MRKASSKTTDRVANIIIQAIYWISIILFVCAMTYHSFVNRQPLVLRNINSISDIDKMFDKRPDNEQDSAH